MKGKMIIFFLLTLSVITSIQAQDAHYWQSGFTPGGFLMPGAVIANNRDSGVFFYNPALLALNPKSSVSISANIYQYEHLNMKEGIGANNPLKSTRLRIVPQIVSGSIALKKKKTIAIGYALIHNTVLGYQATQRQDKKMDVLDNSYSPGQEFYVGQYAAHNKISQTIGVLSAGVKLNERLAIGFSAEGQVRSQDYFEDYRSRALINDGNTTGLSPLTSVSSAYQVVYTHIGVRFKGGLSYDVGKHHFGLLVSSPLVSLKGFATLTSDIEISNLRNGADPTFALNVLANDRQASLPVKYRLPFSIAGAYTLDYGKGQLYVAAEYFHKVDAYNIITPRAESFIRPDTGNANSFTKDLLRFRDEHRSLTNFALGISYHVNSHVTALASFRTDFTYSVKEPENYDGHLPYVVTWDNYHCQLGGNFRRKNANLRAGLLLSYGSTGKHKQPVNFDNPNEGNLMLGNPVPGKATFFSTGLLLSYIHNL